MNTTYEVLQVKGSYEKNISTKDDPQTFIR